MHDACYRAVGGSGIAGIELLTIWDVVADASYDVRNVNLFAGNLIAVRTRGGRGVLYLAEGKLEPGVDSLVVVESNSLRRYHCLGDYWDFVWFEFNISGVVSFPLRCVMQIPELADELHELRSCCRLLRSTRYRQRSYAVARFSALLHAWLSSWGEGRMKHPHQAAVERVIAVMQDKPAGLSVKQMARIAGIGERRFRQVFAEVTGKSPKAFYDYHRLQLGEAMLRQGISNVSETARELGYSSPFHFSRMFREHFGHPPSQLQKSQGNQN